MRGTSILVSEIDKQRQKGWVDFHPEDFCHRCGVRNVKAWWIESLVWNAVMRGSSGKENEKWQGIICPQCFTELFEDAFPDPPPIWELRLDQGQVKS